MAENSAISWTDHTMNFWWGCSKVGPGCDHCYAETFDRRVGGDYWGPGVPRRLVKDWSKPRKWQRQAERTGVRPWVFAQSMSDIFDNEVPYEWRVRALDLVRETPLLRWIFVTKRIGNAAKMLPADWPKNFGHCGLVSTIVNQAEADRDILKLLATPAAWRGLSMEPLLGPVDLTNIGGEGSAKSYGAHGYGALWPVETRPGLNWIIVGGESGPGARPMHPAWARSLRDQCANAGVPFHFKQWGEWAIERSVAGGDLGGDMRRGLVRHVCADRENDGHFRQGDIYMRRVGRQAAGRLLSGVEHNGMPGVAT